MENTPIEVSGAETYIMQSWRWNSFVLDIFCSKQEKRRNHGLVKEETLSPTARWSS
jgi:hypothetical protein